jgi:hypothetical protein
MPGAFPIHCLICTHGPVRALRRTLQSLGQVRRPEGFVTFWVVENGSDAGARRICKTMDHALPLRYHHLAQQGKSKALTWALQQIGEGLVIFTDDDVRVQADWLEHYARAAAEHGEGAFYGGPLKVDYQTLPPGWLIKHLPPSAVGWELPADAPPISKGCFLGANYGAFVSTIQSVGGFDARLGVGSEGNPVGEEFDIQDRMLAAGVKAVYVPQAPVWHWVPHERCTPTWMLRRYERVFLTKGLTEDKDQGGRPIFGAPLWMWQRLAGIALRTSVAFLHPGGEKRFELRKQYYQYHGYVQGVRLRRRQQQRAAASGGKANLAKGSSNG